MPDLYLLLDGPLILALVATAGGTLFSQDLFRAVVLFIAFGLLMSLAWVRLQAPDLALAEAAIGAGLAGALLLDAVGQMREQLQETARPPERRLAWVAGGLCLGILAVMLWAIVSHPQASPRLSQALAKAMQDSGVSHEVTAVLLNFRGYDTFLEMAVLAVAAFAGLALQPLRSSPPPKHKVTNALLDYLVIWLAPVMLMVAVYLFWIGSKAPGGAFQAGAVLAAAGVLLRLSGIRLGFLAPGLALRLGLIGGFGIFLLAGLSGVILDRSLFAYAPESAGLIILVVEAFLALSIGVILLTLFTAAPPIGWESGGEDGGEDGGENGGQHCREPRREPGGESDG